MYPPCASFHCIFWRTSQFQKIVSQGVAGVRTVTAFYPRGSWGYATGYMKIYHTRFRVAILTLTACVVTLGTCCSGFRYWQKSVSETKEQTLRTDLKIMREAIRTYAIKRGELPQTLKDLDADGVYSTVPDPITDRADWQVTIGEDPALVKGKRGVINVHSASTEMSSLGTPYNSW